MFLWAYFVCVFARHRRSAAVLAAALPPKEESVLLVKMSPIQRKLYKAFMDMMGDFSIAAWANANPLKAFSVCCKVTTTTLWRLCTYSVLYKFSKN